ncbi:transcriptional regulator [Burkholderia glumae]|uniref:PhaM family polyhydroxyalkanoate granule multifunctional regulatory protein n=1 Tax=Burkholderia glumae TaxID=337 RepID=UPI000C2725BC|nr:PhaM family polyhydroxyalkanoate granule multifunctional regulatory protein [Burkholderia glumae]MCM2491336.1 transcriptional regulator [Burkholderia glumae]MCM2542329.1 transcriptional regulator [Burkholderia glumae]PJO24553.1 transcriptional regulator [Burkholderia glumae AU6208]RQZ73316.1 transcriptional regulator [Burkholderia glumae]UVS85715.1 transcriptional regulator [Burkholderia glumae]
MTDTPGSNPFPGFAGFKPSDMLDRMWDMMRLSPFGAGIGAVPGQGLPPSLSAMSDMMAPLASVEELDKRITDLRAVEQWLKLNLGMLQSAIQALEVQRATLATLRAFGALAQESMAAAEAAVASGAEAKRTAAPASPFASPFGASPFGAAAPASPASPEAGRAAGAPGEAAKAGPASGNAGAADSGPAPGAGVPPTGAEAFDPAGWWNLLQSQFSQLANFAMTQPAAAAGAGEPKPAPAAEPPRARKPATRRAAPPKPRAPRTGASGEAPDAAPDPAPPPAAKAARKRGP